jgi:hypothetical protein
MQIPNFFRHLAVFVLSAAAIPRVSVAAPVQYAITVNTSSQAGSPGYIDLQFNPSSFTKQLASAGVVNFSSDGTLQPADPNNGTTGNVLGMLPGTVTLTNQQNRNEYTESLLFGQTLSFTLSLTGPALLNPNGQDVGTFTMDFLDSNGNYLFTADPLNDVPVFTVDVSPNGTTDASVYASGGNGPPVVSFSGPTTGVPEPSSVLLVSPPLLALALMMKRRFRAQQISL